MSKSLKTLQIEDIDFSLYNLHLSDCVILTHDNKLLLQKRPNSWRTYPGVVNLFGGHVESNETAAQAVIREIHEEVGAKIKSKDLVFIGAVSEQETEHKELIHIHFWHDKENEITGCYEAEPIYFKNIDEAVNHPKIMDYAVWALKECKKKNTIP